MAVNEISEISEEQVIGEAIFRAMEEKIFYKPFRQTTLEEFDENE